MCATTRPANTHERHEKKTGPVWMCCGNLIHTQNTFNYIASADTTKNNRKMKYRKWMSFLFRFESCACKSANRFAFVSLANFWPKLDVIFGDRLCSKACSGQEPAFPLNIHSLVTWLHNFFLLFKSGTSKFDDRLPLDCISKCGLCAVFSLFRVKCLRQCFVPSSQNLFRATPSFGWVRKTFH